MLAYIANRIVHAIFVLLAVLAIVFAIVHLSGNPAVLALGMDSTDEEIREFSHEMGFDKPLYVQFVNFLHGVITRGDFGPSLRYNEPALPLVLERLPATLKLTGTALFVSILLGIPMGIFSALKRNTILDVYIRMIALLGQSAPVFWLGIMLILIFAVKLPIFPTSGMDRGIISLVLPGIALAHFSTAATVRLLRSSILDTMTQDYVRTARAKGLSEWVVIRKYLLRNSMLPVITFLGLQFGLLLGGAVVTEVIFAWPGVGRLVVQAIHNRDIFLVQATTFVFASMFVLINLLIDILYTFLR